MDTDEQPEIWLVLCTYGPEQPPHLLFESLHWQECRYELPIVDQHCDGRFPRLLHNYPDLPWALLCSARRLSFVRNVGLRHVCWPVLAFPDDDCHHSKGTPRSMLDFFQSYTDEGILFGRNSMEKNVQQTNYTPLSPELISEFLLLRDTPCVLNCIDRRKMPGRTHWHFFDENLGVGALFRAVEETDCLYRLLRDGMQPYGANTPITYHPDKELESSNLRHASNSDLRAGAYLRKDLITDAFSRAMAAWALVGPALRILRSAILAERGATEYHARTARYKGVVTWPSPDRLDKQIAKGLRASESPRAPVSSNLLGVEASGDGKPPTGRQVTVRKNKR